MIMGSSYPGDNDMPVMRVQFETYGELIGFLFGYARERYLAAVRLIGKIDDVSVTIQAVTDFDRKVLEAAHDRIAAYFRFSHPDLGAVQPTAPGTTAKDEISRRWRAYFHSEARHLAEDDHAARAVLKAVVLAGTDTGRDYQGVLLDVLRERYPLPGGAAPQPE